MGGGGGGLAFKLALVKSKIMYVIQDKSTCMLIDGHSGAFHGHFHIVRLCEKAWAFRGRGLIMYIIGIWRKDVVFVLSFMIINVGDAWHIIT